jgi:hypothetical protein
MELVETWMCYTFHFTPDWITRYLNNINIIPVILLYPSVEIGYQICWVPLNHSAYSNHTIRTLDWMQVTWLACRFAVDMIVFLTGSSSSRSLLQYYPSQIFESNSCDSTYTRKIWRWSNMIYCHHFETHIKGFTRFHYESKNRHLRWMKGFISIHSQRRMIRETFILYTWEITHAFHTRKDVSYSSFLYVCQFFFFYLQLFYCEKSLEVS